MKSHLHIDPLGGAAGDMLLAALFDIGLDFEQWKSTLEKLPIEKSLIELSVVQRGVFAAKHLHIGPFNNAPRSGEGAHGHNHDHGHNQLGPQPIVWANATHRSYRDIKALIDESELSELTKSRSHAIFAKLADSEATVHGMSIEDVVFHEVGAIDSILDIIGFSLGIEMLGIESLSCSPLPVSGGIIYTAHGHIPLPAPATLRLMTGWPTRQGVHGHEQVTPTGAAIITTLCEPSSFPAMKPIASGYGAGTRNPTQYANILRASLGRRQESLSDTPSNVIEIRCQIDDMTAEDIPVLIERLLEGGALDADTQPIVMKKGRPALLLTALCAPEDREEIGLLIFRNSTTFGFRYSPMNRTVLERYHDEIETQYGTVRIKVGHRNGEILQRQPEHEDLRAIADANQMPIAKLRQLVTSKIKWTTK